jgi:hypothetical protein
MQPCGLGFDIWKQCRGQAEVRSTQVFTTVHEILWLRRKAASKAQLFQLVQMVDVDMLFPACLLGCLQKRFLGPGLQSAASDGHGHTLHEQTLNNTTSWTL